MNKFYQSVWNSALHSWVAAPETASGQGKKNSVTRKPKQGAPMVWAVACWAVGAVVVLPTEAGAAPCTSNTGWSVTSSTSCALTQNTTASSISVTGTGTTLAVQQKGYDLLVSGNAYSLISVGAGAAMEMDGGARLDHASAGGAINLGAGARFQALGDVDITSVGTGISATNRGSVVVIEGDYSFHPVSAAAAATNSAISLHAENGSLIDIQGNATIVNNNGDASNGLNARFQATIRIHGATDVTTGAGNRTSAINGDSGRIYLMGDVVVKHRGLIDRGAGIAASNSGEVVIDGATSVTTAGAQGIAAGGGGVITLNGAATVSIGSNGNVTPHGIRAITGAKINLQDSRITTAADGSAGMIAAGGTIAAAGWASLDISGQNSKGIYATGAGSTIALAGGNAVLKGEASHGLYAETGGRITSSGDMQILGDTAAGVQGVYAQNGAITLDGNLNSKTSSHGVHVSNTGASSASVRVAGSSGLTTTQDGASAVYLSGQSSQARLEGAVNLRTEGARSNGIYLQGTQAQALTLGGALNITSTGAASARQPNSAGCTAGAAICLQGDAASLSALQGGSIDAGHGYAIQMEAGSGQQLQLAGMLIGASGADQDMALIEVNNQAASSALPNNPPSIHLTDTQVMANAARSSALLLNVSQASRLHLQAQRSTLQGNVRTSDDSVVQLALQDSSALTGTVHGLQTSAGIDASSTWTMTGNSALYEVQNAGAINFAAPGSSNIFKTLTVHNYVGTNARLGINTYLFDDTSVSDKLVIDAIYAGSGAVAPAQASGNTALHVDHRGGLGALTVGKGIQVVQAVGAATTTADAFALGHKVTAGAYEYSLRRDADQSWYLVSKELPPVNPDNPPFPPNPQPAEPDYSDQPFVASTVPALAQSYGALTSSSWRERMGGLAYANPTQLHDASSGVSPLWVRLATEHSKHHGGQRFSPTAGGQAYQAAYDAQSNFLQLGADVYRIGTAEQQRHTLGVFFTTGSIHADVRTRDQRSGARQAGSSDASLSNTALGAYWTTITPEGSYVDVVGQYIDHDVTVRADADQLSSQGHSWVASLEGGKAYALGSAWTLVPQGQLRWQKVHLDRLDATASGTTVGHYTFNATDALQARLGVEARYQTQPQRGAWIRLDVLHEFKGDSSTRYTSRANSEQQPQFASARKGTSVKLLAGVDTQLKRNVSVYGAAGYERGLSSQNKGHAWTAQVGVRWGF